MVDNYTTEEMRLHLQEMFCVPIAVRKEGAANIDRCPYCSEPHTHGPLPGHRVAHCIDNVGILVKDREFVPNYGYIIYHYDVDNKGNFMLLDHR